MKQASANFYSNSIVVDACAPMAPFSEIQGTLGPNALMDAYSTAGVTLAVLTIVDDYPNSIEQTIKLIAKNRRYFLDRADRFAVIDQVEDVHKTKAQNRLAVAFSFQGTNALLGELALVEVYRRLGVVQMLLAYNVGNLAADGCHESRNAGLTRFGCDLILEMNRVGMLVDLTHVGLRSSLEALELTSQPPVFSHSSPKRFAPHDRNITDEQIRACANKGGVVCLTGVGLFMDSQAQKASTSKFVDTIDYVAQLVGPKHVGVGLDYIMDAESMARYLRANTALYGGGEQYPADGHIEFLPPSTLSEVAQELARRGYTEGDVRGILGENWLRAAAQVLRR